MSAIGYVDCILILSKGRHSKSSKILCAESDKSSRRGVISGNDPGLEASVANLSKREVLELERDLPAVQERAMGEMGL